MTLDLEPRPALQWNAHPPVADRAATVRPMPVPARERADRRGPLRPGRLIASRSRLNAEVLAHSFRAADLLTVAVLAWLACDLANPAGGVWASPVAAVAPFAVAAGVLGFCLYAVGAYGFRARETIAAHLGRVAGAFALTLGVMVATLIVLAPADRPWRAGGTWFCLAFSGIYLLHIWWWFAVRGLRRSGRLMPNVVVVGATANAERLIEKAVESREVAVLGIFDDRLARAPQSVHGVRVLGDTTALVGHRIMPCVDRIVITVTASAQARVRALAEQLSVLPNEVALFVDFGGEEMGGGLLSPLADLPLVTLSSARTWRGRVKRVQDLLGAPSRLSWLWR
jgi:polysaccharide biosynthesis protein PslA